MKFRKSSTRSSPKMELLRRSSGGNKISGFKRSKSFRASVKLMSKIRNHANLHATPSYDLSAVSPNAAGSPKSKIQNLTLVAESIEEETNHRSECSTVSHRREYEKVLAEESSGRIVKDLESKLSLTSNCKAQSPIKDGAGCNKFSVRSDKFNAYENPSFMDSSLDRSMTGFFHEDNLDQADDRAGNNGETVDSPVLPEVEKPDKKSQIESRLTVIMENEQICKKHHWCTRAKSSAAGKGLFRVSKEPEAKCISVATFKGYINDAYDENKVFPSHRITLPKTNRQEFVVNRTRNSANLPRSIVESRIRDNVAYTLRTGARAT